MPRRLATRHTDSQNFTNWLWTFDDRAALLAPIRSSAFFSRFQFLEFIVSLAGSLETFRTIAIPKFLAVHGQMAMAAAQRSLSYWQQFESHVLAGSHDSKCRFLMNVGGIGEPSKSDHAIFVFARTNPLRLLQTHVRRVEDIAGVFMLLEVLQNSHPDMAIPAKLFPIPQSF